MNRLCGRKPLVERLRRTVFRDGRSVIVRGEAGIGKSSLVRHVVARPKHSHAVVRISTSPRGANLRFGSFATYLGGDGAAPSDAQALLAIGAALRAEAAGRALVLVVDDAHYLDDPSAAAIDQLVRTGEVQLVAAVPPQSVDWIDRLTREESVVVETLRPLDAAGVGELVEALLAGPVDAELVDEIQRLSGGSPWRVKELVRAAQSRGAIERNDGRWVPVGGLPIPDVLVAPALQQLERLDDDVRATVDLVVVAGELEMGLLEHHGHGGPLGSELKEAIFAGIILGDGVDVVTAVPGSW